MTSPSHAAASAPAMGTRSIGVFDRCQNLTGIRLKLGHRQHVVTQGHHKRNSKFIHRHAAAQTVIGTAGALNVADNLCIAKCAYGRRHPAQACVFLFTIVFKQARQTIVCQPVVEATKNAIKSRRPIAAWRAFGVTKCQLERAEFFIGNDIA